MHDLQLLAERRENESERAEAIWGLLAIAAETQDPYVSMTVVMMLFAVNRMCGGRIRDRGVPDARQMQRRGDERTAVRVPRHERAGAARGGDWEDGGVSDSGRTRGVWALVPRPARPDMRRTIQARRADGARRRSPLEDLRNAANGNRTFSRYFWVAFYADGFGKYFQDRSYVYRRPGKSDGSFIADLKAKALAERLHRPNRRKK
jgi:hypothetical protein